MIKKTILRKVRKMNSVLDTLNKFGSMKIQLRDCPFLSISSKGIHRKDFWQLSETGKVSICSQRWHKWRKGFSSQLREWEKWELSWKVVNPTREDIAKVLYNTQRENNKCFSLDRILKMLVN